MKNSSKIIIISKIIRVLFVFVFAAINFSFVTGQVKKTEEAGLPVLTKKEMFADFDRFVKTVIETSPQNPVRKAVTGIDALQELKKMRSRIPKLKATEEFAYLIRAAINTLQDGHSSLLPGNYLTADEAKEEGISETALKLMPVYADFLLTVPAQKNKFDLRLKYLNGEYYNIAPFTHNNEVFESGLKLVEVNGRNVHSVVARLYPYIRMMRWDYERRRYYLETFYKAYNFSPDKIIKLKFSDKTGKTKISDFKLSEGLNFINPPQGNVDQTKKVEYFSDEQILYIRLPKMDLNDRDFYPAEIKAKAAGKPVKKVIIDIRDNPGGTDNVWTGVLKAIIDKPIVFTDYLLCNPSPEMKSKYPKELENWKPYNAAFLNGYEYAIFASGEKQFNPDADSIKFGGKIYILQNENIYSSSGAMAAVGVLAPNIYMVGEPTGRLLGRGLSPLDFELPNSKILYRLEQVIDFLNVSKAVDVFHDKVEIPVPLTIENYLERINNRENRYRREFLFKNDPVFLRAVND